MLRYRQHPLTSMLSIALIFLGSGYLFQGCGSQISFAVVHLIEKPGEQISEVISYQTEPGLDNSTGTAPLQVQIEFERTFYYKIIERMTNNEVPAQKVRDKIVEMYKLPPNNPEETLQTALCPVSIVIPAGKKAIITVEWTERWADGVVNEGTQGEGDRLGTYSVFLGYLEPCSLVKQENVD